MPTERGIRYGNDVCWTLITSRHSLELLSPPSAQRKVQDTVDDYPNVCDIDQLEFAFYNLRRLITTGSNADMMAGMRLSLDL
jgi:hypothetical protein